VISTSRSQLKPSLRSLAVVATSYAPFHTITRFVADGVIATDRDDTSRVSIWYFPLKCLTRTQLVITQTTWCQNGQLIHTDGEREPAMIMSKDGLTSSGPSDPGWITSIVPHVSMRDKHRTSLGSKNTPVYVLQDRCFCTGLYFS
jgi:hypothetical protein